MQRTVSGHHPHRALRFYRVVLNLPLFSVFNPFASEESTVSYKSPSIVHRYLPNGMEVYLERTNLAPLSCIQLWIRTGSIDEAEHEAGLAHFTEHMLFKGTKLFPGVGEVAQFIESAGGDINAFTKFENTVYQATVPSHFTQPASETLLDMVTTANFAFDEIERERSVILEEASRLRDHPGSVASLNLFSEVFRGCPFERPIIGHIDVIKNAPHGLIQSFYKRWYVPNNMIFVAAGDFDPQTLFEYLQKITANVKPGQIPTRNQLSMPLVPQKLRAARITRGPWQEARVTFGCAAPVLEAPECPAWHMFASLMGSGDSCRLTRIVHDELQLVAAIDAGIFMPRSPMGMFTMNYFGEAAKSADAAAAAIEELMRLAQDGPTSSEMSRIINNMLADRIFGRESVEGLVNNAGFSLQTSRKLAFEDEYIKNLQKVNATQIQEIANNVCQKIKSGHAIFSIAADEHAPQDFCEEGFLEHVRAPLNKSVAMQGWQQSVASKEYNHTVSSRDPNVQQIQFYFPGGSELHINYREVKRLPIVSASLSFRGGTSLEDDDKHGIAHIATELLTHGTARQTYESFVDELEDKAASLSTFSTHDLCGIQMDCLSEHAPRTFEMMLDCVFRPTLSSVQFERVRTDSLNAVIAQKDNPMVRIRRKLSPILFGNHAYSKHPLGTEESLAALTHNDVQIQLHRTLAAKKFVLSVAGDFDLNRFVSKIHTEFSHLTKLLDAEISEQWENRVNGKTPASPTVHTNRFAFEEMQREQSHLAMAFRTFPITDERRLAIELGSTVLGGQGGRLFRDLRDVQSLAYSLGTSQTVQAQAGCFYAFMGTAPQKMQDSYSGLKSHLERMAAENITEQELERAKSSILGGRNIDSQYFHYQASQLSMSDLYGMDFDNFLRFDERVHALSANDIREAFASALSQNPLAACIIGPSETWRPEDPNLLLWH